MIQFLARKFIPDYRDFDNATVRHAYGNLTSTVGIFNNIVLCIFKFIAGTLSHSVSITADAVNNLSDAGSSMIALVSFKLSNKPADEKHPFGHARYECIASMLIATLILLLGLELIKTSFDKILHPEEIIFSWISIVVLVFSIIIKFWMYMYNKSYGKKLNASVLEATAADSISDVMGTGAVLLSTIISPLIHFNLDGYMGIVVACFIIVTGYGIIRSALDELLGQAPDEHLVDDIHQFIKTYNGVLGIHDMVIHDYGAHRQFASVHVEVNCKVDVLKSHDMIDNIERDIREQMDIELVIHMDPIDVDDPLTKELRLFIKQVVKEIHKDLSMHDFRVVPGETHTNMIFDVVVPYHIEITNGQIKAMLEEKVHEQKGTMYYLVITFDRAFTL